MLRMSSLATCDLGVELPSCAACGVPVLTSQALLGEPTPESSFGGDLLLGLSVLLSAAGTPMAVRGWYMPWCR
jgi:hypothetical protein